jgi:hypothetical protein
MVRGSTLALGVLAAAGVLAASPVSASADARGGGSSGDTRPLAAHTQYFSAWVSMPAGINRQVSVACPAGQVPTGGGGQTQGTHTYLTDSYAQGGSWTVKATNTGTVAESMRAFVVCTTP